MARSTTFAWGLAAAAALLVRAATGCGASSNLAGGPEAGEGASADAGEGASASNSGNDGGFCFGALVGCQCFAVDACPGEGGCYVTQTVQPDGSASEPFCGSGIAICRDNIMCGGGGWSFGEIDGGGCSFLNPPSCTPEPPLNSSPQAFASFGNYIPTHLDGGPDGAVCCEYEINGGI